MLGALIILAATVSSIATGLSGAISSSVVGIAIAYAIMVSVKIACKPSVQANNDSCSDYLLISTLKWFFNARI